jgi:hypothetical protein
MGLEPNRIAFSLGALDWRALTSRRHSGAASIEEARFDDKEGPARYEKRCGNARQCN